MPIIKLILSTPEAAEMVFGNKSSNRAFERLMDDLGVKPIQCTYFKRGDRYCERQSWSRGDILRAIRFSEDFQPERAVVEI